ncbi:MAG TPA: choice-of-anchor tandem repeat GloVer-containing protein [Terriglobales bacterium]|nr:choice-of-anchor tandem repeat GloVer-containing protein [Terriglobales bacterium]
MGSVAPSVFKLDKSGTATDLYSFTSGADGGNPQDGLAIDASGNLYGTTSIGGLSSCMTGGAAIGCGVVFKLDPNGKETVLYTFTGGSNDGANPNGDLVLDSSGNLYGTTSHGGTADVGTVFKLAPNGVLTILHDFTNGTDGGAPRSGVVLDAAGNLYGSASSGGGDPTCSGGCGVIFKIAPAEPDFSISASALSPKTIRQGGSSSSTLSVTAVAGFNGNVSLSCSVQPTPALAPKCSISPNSVAPGNSAMLTVTTTGPSATLRANSTAGWFYALSIPLMGLMVKNSGFPPGEEHSPIRLRCGHAVRWRYRHQPSSSDRLRREQHRPRYWQSQHGHSSGSVHSDH